MFASDNIVYKSKIMNQLCSMPDIVTLINNPAITQANPDAMKNVNIFSRMRIPNTTISVKNYICFNFNSRTFGRNEVLKTVWFDLAIICEGSDINYLGANRHDYIAGIIANEFTWSNFLGFELELVSDVESVIEPNYYVRTLQFKNLAPNNLVNGAKLDGY